MITWGTTVFTDRELKHNWPGITIVHKNTQEWTLIGIAVPADQDSIIVADITPSRSDSSQVTKSSSVEFLQEI